MHAILMHWSQNASTNRFLCICNPLKSVTKAALFLFFLTCTSLKRDEVGNMRKLKTQNLYRHPFSLPGFVKPDKSTLIHNMGL